jgi:hypothetical protein
MNPIDPKLVDRARWLRPDLAQRLIAIKATQAGRGILIKPARGDLMPAKPPLPAMPDATAAKAAVLQKIVHGTSDAPREIAVEAYREEGARTAEAAPVPVPARADAPVGERNAGTSSEPSGRPIPFAIAALPPRPEEVEDYFLGKGGASGRERRSASARPRGSGSVERIRAGRLALGFFAMLAIVAGLVVLAF